MSRELFNEIRNEMPSSISIEDMDVIEIEDKKYHVEKIEELNTYGKEIIDLLSVQFCDKVVDLFKKGELIIKR